MLQYESQSETTKYATPKKINLQASSPSDALQTPSLQLTQHGREYPMHTTRMRMRVMVRVAESMKMDRRLRKKTLLPVLLKTDKYTTFTRLSMIKLQRTP